MYVYRFYLIERESGVCVAIYEAQTFFSFHHVNAYEDTDGLVVVDLCCYPDASIVDMFYLHHLRGSKMDKVTHQNIYELISPVQLSGFV